MRKRMYFIAPIAILAMIAFTIIGGELVMRLWNWLLPGLFGWRTLTFWQALGLLALCRILFGGFGLGRSRPSGMRSAMRQRMEERWERMTPEEREKYRARCGGFGTPSSGTGVISE